MLVSEFRSLCSAHYCAQKMSIDPTTQHSVRVPAPLSTPESLDEKSVGAKLEIPGASVASAATSIEEEDHYVPSEAEDRAVRRKLDLVVMPMLFLGFYVFQVGCMPGLPALVSLTRRSSSSA
jgi:hypothetical protein